MITCNNCGTNNIDGSDYCDECGMKLDMNPRGRSGPPIYQPPSAVQNDRVPSKTVEGPPPAPPSFTTSTAMPKPAIPARDARGGRSGERITGSRAKPESNTGGRVVSGPSRTYILSSKGRTDTLRSEGAEPESPGARVVARLVIERGGRIGKEFPISGIETNIGRWDADSGIFPDVDLDEDDPEAKISRRHARIVNNDGEFFIEDLGSTNGTFVNRGRRLLPGKRHMLQSGDEIIVGKTFLKFQIVR